MKKATISDVADKAGVSKSTVSAVLNGSASVKDETRERILEAIEALNYRPSPSARRLRIGEMRRSKSKCIGLVVKENDNPFYAEVAVGAQASAEAQGYTLFVACSSGDYRREKEIIDTLQSKCIDGLILSPVLDDKTDLSHLFELKRARYPFVLLEGIRGVQASIVDIDNVAASMKAARYLLQLGHTRILHFGGPAYSTHSQERADGFRLAFSASSEVCPDDAIIATGSTVDAGYRQALAIFGDTDRPRPTAVTCFNDLVAIGVHQALLELGLRVPDDVSLIGYDDVRLLRYREVPLTTIRTPNREMGEKAAELLIKQVEAPSSLPPERVHLQAELIIRKSTRALTSAVMA